jgi:hypothetical protein
LRPILTVVPLIFLTAGTLFGQTITQVEDPAQPEVRPESPVTVSLDVPKGTPLPVVLDKEFRIRKEGQPIHGKIAEPIYAFDKLVVPAGSEVTGSVTKISGVSAQQRTFAALDANFSPHRDVEITFDELVLADGRRFPLHTQVSLASGGVLQFATAPEDKSQSKKGVKAAAQKRAAEKVDETKQEINRDWEMAKQQIAAPGKMHKLKRIAVAQLPFHPQYFDAGTRFNAELLEPLNFGSEALTPDKVHLVGTSPAPGSVIHALLKTPLTSATAQKGEAVEAIMTEPLLADNQLILPEGTVLRGSVLQVQAARRLRRNGQLRIVFHQIVPPESAAQNVEASLEGVEVNAGEHLSLDSEGGAQATDSKTKYLTTGISLALVGVAFWPDADAGRGGSHSVLEIGGKGAEGASGFSVIGFVTGLAVRSRPVGYAFSIYGAGMSVYDHFLSRGQDVIYPKDTAMAIGFGSRVTGATKATPQT